MPKTKSKPSFVNAGPLQTGLTVLLIMSVLVNLGVLLFYVLINHTANYDNDLYDYTRNKICVSDYAQLSHDDQERYAGFCK